METAAGLIKLKPGTSADVDAWRETLLARETEVLETLRKEGVRIEAWFRIEIEGQPYLLWFMKAESIARAREVFVNSSEPIDAYHLEMMTGMAEAQIFAEPLIALATEPGR